MPSGVISGPTGSTNTVVGKYLLLEVTLEALVAGIPRTVPNDAQNPFFCGRQPSSAVLFGGVLVVAFWWCCDVDPHVMSCGWTRGEVMAWDVMRCNVM